MATITYPGASQSNHVFVHGRKVFDPRPDPVSSKNQENEVPEQVDSTSDDRVINNTMRHQYKVLSDSEKAQSLAIKDKGLELYLLIESLGDDQGGYVRLTSALLTAQRKAEEAVMWAVKHITG